MSLDAAEIKAPPPRDDEGLDVWWSCLKPNCYLFFATPTARDEHMRTCAGCEEIPF